MERPAVWKGEGAELDAGSTVRLSGLVHRVGDVEHVVR